MRIHHEYVCLYIENQRLIVYNDWSNDRQFLDKRII